MNLFDYKQRKQFEGSHLIGTLIIASSIIVGIVSTQIDFNPPFNNMIPLVTCMFIIGLIMLFTYSGVEINFTKNGFREYIFICGIKLGEWSPIPHISKIKLKSATIYSTNTPNGISPTFSGSTQEHRVILYANTPTPLLSFSYKKREVGLKNANLLASNLNTLVEVE